MRSGQIDTPVASGDNICAIPIPGVTASREAVERVQLLEYKTINGTWVIVFRQYLLLGNWRISRICI